MSQTHTNWCIIVTYMQTIVLIKPDNGGMHLYQFRFLHLDMDIFANVLHNFLKIA